jgi:periplasmic divalent cation tolerance protein
MDTGSACVVLVTMPDREKALAMAHTLVEEKLAACVNVGPEVRSVYRWQGKVSEDPEVLCVMKTTRDGFEALRARVVSLHPYEVPEVIALPVVAGHAPYLDWLLASVA